MKNKSNKRRREKYPILKRFLVFLFTVAMAFSTVNVQALSEEVEVPAKQELAQTEFEPDPEKYYCHATIDQDFAEDSVLVVIKSSHGGINKLFSKKQFSTEKFNANTSFKAIEDLTYLDKPIEEYQYLKIGMHKQIFKLTLEKPGKQNILNTIQKLKKLNFIKNTKPNYHATLSVAPNDSRYSAQRAIKEIEIEQAWDITTGSSAVSVGVIDSGIVNHNDLNGNVVPGWDYYNMDAITTDDPNSHGTAVAGIIGAVGNNSCGIAGVCWNVQLVPMQTVYYDSSVGEYFLDADAIIRAINDANVDIPIINCSYGRYDFCNAEMNALSSYKGLAVCAAGNENQNTDYVSHYPACYPLDNIISVGALDSTLTAKGVWRYGYASNYGQTTVDLFAPGTDEYTTINCDESGTVTPNQYTIAWGTSFSAPFVTGVAALIKSIRPNATPTEIKAFILQNVDLLPEFDKLCVTGGKLNAYKAVKAAQEGRFETENLMGDVNGDGRDDVIIHWTNSSEKRVLLTLISSGSGYFPTTGVNFVSTNVNDPYRWPASFFVADVNNDGKDDFIVQWCTSSKLRTTYTYLGKASSSGGYFSAAVSSTSSIPYKLEDHVFTGDFNGDGRADLLLQTKNASNKRQLVTFIGNADGSFGPGVTFTSNFEYYPFRLIGRWSVPSQFFVGDVNGDGYDDFVVHERIAVEGVRKHIVYRGKVASPYFSEGVETVTTDGYQIADKVYAGDFTGDGKMDLLVHWRKDGFRQLLLYKGTATGAFAAGVNFTSTRKHDPAVYSTKINVGKTTGSANASFIVHWVTGNSNTTAIKVINYLGGASSMLEGVNTTTNAPFSSH